MSCTIYDRAKKFGCPDDILDKMRYYGISHFTIRSGSDTNWESLGDDAELLALRQGMKKYTPPEPINNRWEILDL
jgi:hypothetical protein